MGRRSSLCGRFWIASSLGDSDLAVRVIETVAEGIANMNDDKQAAMRKQVATDPSKRLEELPQYNVILLNDEVNEFCDVVRHVSELTPLNKDEAIASATAAHKTGHSLLLTTHKERAELYQQQFASLRPPIGISIEEEKS